MRLYNSLSRAKEEFTPLRPGKAEIYVCGITAYDLCHVGHARSALVFDVLVRYLRSTGLAVHFTRNFTDVDDKIIRRAQNEGRDWRETAETYMRAFHEDMDRLEVLRADEEPRATEYIPQMSAICARLIDAGKAYVVPSGDVYFRVRAFPGYGRLSGRSPDELRAGARIAPGEEKEDPLDFALWKAAKPGEPFWDSPWGNGRPGWHIECSAMSEARLPLDIHGGGLDLIFPHHENEIAQSEGAGAPELARFWVHNGFVRINSEKMSKSLGNFTTIRDILQQYLPETLRFFLLGKHYRSPVDFSAEGMNEAEKAQKRMYQALAEAAALGDAAGKVSSHAAGAEILRTAQEAEQAFTDALEDDLNTASALGHAFTFPRLMKRIQEEKALRKSAEAQEFCALFRRVAGRWQEILGVFGAEPAEFLARLRECRIKRANIDSAALQRLLDERAQARLQKDFAASDALRTRMLQLGVKVRDTPQGQEWEVAD